MYKFSVLRQVSATIAGLFGTTRESRRLKRDKIKFHGLIETVGQNRLPREKYAKRIPISFCFDARGCKLAAVSIKSLLDASHGRCDYDIYCVVTDDVDKSLQNIITNIVDDSESKVYFLNGNNDFDKSYRAKWPIAVWYRLMLPKLLPNIDKIIYADIDIIFCNDLIDVYELDMGTNIVAGVPTQKNGYINSGFLVMDLAKIRAEKVYEKWIKASQSEKYENPDQDCLNYTLENRKLFLPVKYNFQARLGSRIFQMYSEIELDDLKHNLVVMHYSNYIKPWSNISARPIYSEIWWNTAHKTGLFE